jgi:hypothetical protein
MSINTYATLKTAIVSWLNISATDIASQIDDLVTLGETRIFRKARTRDMEAVLSSTIASGVISLPTSYVALKFAYIDGTPTQRLERRSAEWIYMQYPVRSSEGKPKYIAREGTSFIFGPYADSAYTVKGIYYKRLDAISSSVNALFSSNPDLYLFACLAESEPIIGRDQRIALWESKFQSILADVNGEDQAEDHSSGVLQMRIG